MRQPAGSVVARAFQPWYLRSAEVECFLDGSYHWPLGADGHFFRRQLEGFATTVLDGAPQLGAGVATARVLAAIERSLESGEPVAP